MHLTDAFIESGSNLKHSLVVNVPLNTLITCGPFNTFGVKS